ncbi:MAG TPA: methyl-accepting chemotaxis protein [Clostridia bacterium]|nr:methyl-accepting chemotaxis protein [Clostridia bacterium]
MELINEFIRKRIRFLIARPFLTAGIFTLVFSTLMTLVLGLKFYEFAVITIIMAIAIELITYILVNEAKGKLESVAYIMQRIKNRDLNQSLDLNEFHGLESVSMGFNNMMDELRSILGSLKTISLDLVQASEILNTNSEGINATMDDISATMDDIAHGSSEQASEAERGVNLITNLSRQIHLVHQNTASVADDSENMRQLNSRGLEAVETLKTSNVRSARTAAEVSQFIRSFVEKSQSIGEFVSAINTIAEQTNLLALNAAIEAARAGEAGRGFAVVADEVRKLADNSKKSTEHVEDIMEGIMEEADTAFAMMDTMDEVVSDQTNAVDNTTDTFNVIASNIENIIGRIDDISQSIAIMEKDKDDVTYAMQNISAVSEEAAAASQEIAAATQEQKNSIAEMVASSKTLNQLSLELRRHVEVYKV